MNTCYVIGAGEVDALDICPDESDIIICADGGYDHAKNHGVRVDLIVGDFDSINNLPSDVDVLTFPPEKDFTDSYLAVRAGLERGYKKFALYGLLGGRPDHTFSNYELLMDLAGQGYSAYAVGCGFMVYILKNSSIHLLEKDSGIISIFSFSDQCTGVTIRGLKYEVEGFTMTNNLTRGLSNEFCGSDAFIEVKDGALIIFEQL